MSQKLKVVAVAGSVQTPSRTLVLVEQILNTLAEQRPIDARVIELGAIAPQLAGALDRTQASPSLEADLQAIEQADVLLVASPVYRGSYTGLFKHLFDLVDHEALVDVPVLLAATGGSERHALVIDHQLRPLFSFFQAQTLPIGVYATPPDFQGGDIGSPALRERIALAVSRALPLLQPRAAQPHAAARLQAA